MSYNQEKNPLSRKTSPLNENNPFKRISPLSMAEEGVKHKDMSKDDKKKHKKAKHSKGGDPDMEREMREEEMRRENNEPMGPQRSSSDLTAYKNVDAEDIPGYDDGAGGFDYEAKAKANSAPGAQYTDEAAEAAFKKMKYTTDAAIRSGAGVDLGTIENKDGMSRKKNKRKPGETKTEFRNRLSGTPNPDVNFRKARKKKGVSRKSSPLNADKNRDEEIRELSVNKAMKGRRTMKNRDLKPAGKVDINKIFGLSFSPDVSDSMRSMTSKAKPVTIPKPKKTTKETVETRARKSVKAPSKDKASKMSISRKKSKYKK